MREVMEEEMDLLVLAVKGIVSDLEEDQKAKYDAILEDLMSVWEKHVAGMEDAAIFGIANVIFGHEVSEKAEELKEKLLEG